MKRPVRAAFTLFELILAIALAAVLLTIIGMAINLYLTRVSMSRDRVEEAQLARSILAMIADEAIRSGVGSATPPAPVPLIRTRYRPSAGSTPLSASEPPKPPVAER